MTLRAQLDADLKEAMKARDQVRLNTIRSVKSAMKYKEVEGGEAVSLDDDGIMKVLVALVKQRKDAIEQFRAQKSDAVVKGRIVNITSVDAFKAHPQNAHYAATKAAVVSLTRSFAQEVARDNILVNSVAPAGMATEKARQAGFLAELAAASPLGRGGEPREMAEWVLMAGGPKNTYMTGENIIVSGGYIYA